MRSHGIYIQFRLFYGRIENLLGEAWRPKNEQEARREL